MDDIDALLREVQPYTLTLYVRLRAMAGALLSVEANGVPGDVVECGVWRGGNIILARKLLPTRRCWLYDTFAGMTEPGPEDLRRSGKPATEIYSYRKRHEMPWCMASLADVLENFKETGTFDPALCRFIAGDVVETLLVPENLPETISVLRLDTDWYASTRLELEILYPRLSSGGVLILDDYGHWRGAKQAADEYLGKDARFIQIDYSAVSLIKP